MPGDSRPAGGPGLAQVRRIATEIPGPRSRELLARQRGLVPAGAGAVLPVFVEAVGGCRRGRQTFIDFGSGIAVTTVGNSAPAVAERAAATAAAVHPHLFPGEPVSVLLELLGEAIAGEGAAAWLVPDRKRLRRGSVGTIAAAGRPEVTIITFSDIWELSRYFVPYLDTSPHR